MGTAPSAYDISEVWPLLLFTRCHPSEKNSARDTVTLDGRGGEKGNWTGIDWRECDVWSSIASLRLLD